MNGDVPPHLHYIHKNNELIFNEVQFLYLIILQDHHVDITEDSKMKIEV
jgi:hypothetical protein